MQRNVYFKAIDWPFFSTFVQIKSKQDARTISSRSFINTAKHLNTTKAAEILRLSQPAISKSIKELEKGLRITLFDREKGRLMLTPAGKYLLEQSEELIERERIITFNPAAHEKRVLRDFTHRGQYHATQYILPEYLARFRKLIPISK